jgi:putative ATPase
MINNNLIPLAERLRPKKLAEVIGQAHLLSPEKPLYEAVVQQYLPSLILWGPPGVGKTTIAEILAESIGAHFVKLSAILSGVKEVREILSEAERLQALNTKVVLFVDEIHRFNKAQQDAFLHHLEKGIIILIGATTENPSFELNSALLSRMQVYVLNPLTHEELDLLFMRASTQFEEYSFDTDSKATLIAMADGDGRRLLNLIELIIEAARAKNIKTIHTDFLQKLLPQQLRRFDKGGEVFYDQISALHKAVRGSDPNAALYWFCRMLDGGIDTQYLARRIIRMAWEDIGLADPRAIELAMHAAATYERLGAPEGELALAEAIIYLAIAAKSNAAYQAFNAAKALVKKDQSRPVPLHLRNAPTALMKNLGYGKDYRYAHNETHHYAAGENYWPEGLAKQAWYQPTDQGLEQKIAEKLALLAKLDKEANGE